MYRFFIYHRLDDSRSWESFGTPIAERNGEPITEPWSLQELAETLDDYVQVSDGQWYAQLVDATTLEVLAETHILDRNVGEWLDY